MPLFRAVLIPTFDIEADDIQDAQQTLARIVVGIGQNEHTGRAGVYAFVRPSQLDIKQEIQSIPIEWTVHRLAPVVTDEERAMADADDGQEAN